MASSSNSTEQPQKRRIAPIKTNESTSPQLEMRRTVTKGQELSMNILQNVIKRATGREYSKEAAALYGGRDQEIIVGYNKLADVDVGLKTKCQKSIQNS